MSKLSGSFEEPKQEEPRKVKRRKDKLLGLTRRKKKPPPRPSSRKLDSGKGCIFSVKVEKAGPKAMQQYLRIGERGQS